MSVATFGFTRFQLRSAEERVNQLLDSAVKRVSREIPAEDEKFNMTEFLEETRDMAADGIQLQIVNAAGKTLFPDARVKPFDPKDTSYRFRVASYGGNRILLAYWFKPHVNAIEGALVSMILFSLIFVCCAAIGAWQLVGRTLTPIDKLARQTETISGLQSNATLCAPSADTEIVSLVYTLNGLLNRIRKDSSARGRFYAAASHELRTPLQALTGHLELALTRDRSNLEYREVVAEANGQAQRLSRLVQELLFLNQLENSHKPQLDSVSILETVQSSLESIKGELQNRNLTTEIDISKESFLVAPRAHVETLVRNLLENAVKYSDFGSVVQISVSDHRLSESSASREAQSEFRARTLSVFNASSAETAWIANLNFEPFHRLDASRNSSTGGNGLGLAICKSVSDINGWCLSLEAVRGGVCASVDFNALREGSVI